MSDLTSRLAAALETRYQIGQELGSGGTAIVFSAHDLKHGRTVAIKVLQPQLAAVIGPERFLREIQIAARLRHPHILPLFDSGEIPAEGVAPPLLYYIMPLAEGESLRDRLDREGRLPVSEAIRIAREVAGALASAHAAGVVHRDIKPENILLESGNATVADFGIARAIGHARLERETTSQQLTEEGSAIGTPAYMSPEQIEGRNDLDGRSDQYSLGCVLFELLTGQRPFVASTPTAVAARHFVDPVPRVRQFRPEVSGALEAVVSRSLAKSPADRFPTADEFGAALARAERGGGGPRLMKAVLFTVLPALAVVAAALVLWKKPPPLPPEGTASGLTVAILPFTVRGDPSLAYLGEGMVNLLSTKLGGAGDIHAVDPRALLSFVTSQSGPMTPEQGRSIADRFDAGYYVIGDIIELGNRLQFTATMYQTDGDQAIAPVSALVAPEQLFAAVDSIASKLLADWSGKQSRLTGIAALTTDSIAALRAYLEGDRAFRRGDFDSAVIAFRRAVTVDTAFALAWYRLSISAEWLTQADLQRVTADQALRHSSHLAEHDRLLLEATVAERYGRFDEAKRLYQTITGTYPDDVEAWIQLGELLFHSGPSRGYNASESRDAWVRVLSFEPDNLGALVHLGRVAAAEGKTAELDSIVERIVRIRQLAPAGATGGREEVLEMEALRAFAAHDTIAENRVVADLERASDLTVALTGLFVGTFPHNFAGASRIFRILEQPERALSVRSLGYRGNAHLELAQGHWKAAQEILDTLATFDQVSALEFRILMSEAPFLPAPGNLEPLVRRLATARPLIGTTAQNQSVHFTIHDRLHRVIATYLTGLVAARAGDRATALQEATRLADWNDGDETASQTAHALAHGIRAESAVHDRSIGNALSELEKIGQNVNYQVAIASPFVGSSRERFVRAECLRQLGRREEALRLYASFTQFGVYDLIYMAPSELALARLYEQAGDGKKAVEHYRQFLSLWKTADPELQPMVTEAEQKVSELSRK